MRHRLLAFVLGVLPAVFPARADELADSFATVWESLWQQAGTPTYVVRWADEVRVRFTGGITDRYREHAMSALRETTGAAGLKLRDVTAEADAENLANLEFRVTGDYDLQDNMPCITRLQRWRNWLLEKVLVEVRPRNVWNCTHHEVMHAMGIRGHPTGKTVLSYYANRRDVLLPMDVLMLKAWYAPAMKPGSTPFEALQVMTDAVVEAGPEEGRAAARAAQAQFLRSTLQEMERYARGEGEVPRIVFRSGRGTEAAMAAGRNLMAFFVGVAYLRGIGAPVNLQQGLQWIELAAEKGNAAAKVMLERRKKAAEK